MKCAYLIPTANPALCSDCFGAWREMGWDTIALTEDLPKIDNCTAHIRRRRYLGWGESFNLLARLFRDQYDWMATGGDDVYPDMNVPAAEIGRQLTEHFGGTMGVCQPTADWWAWNKCGETEPICYAPIIGREFTKRWNGGRGAFWPGYFQWFADNDLYRTTTAAGLLWERPDLFFEHRHVAKRGRPSPEYKVSKHWRWPADRDLFNARKAAGFPDHEPLPRNQHSDRLPDLVRLLPTGQGG